MISKSSTIDRSYPAEHNGFLIFKIRQLSWLSSGKLFAMCVSKCYKFSLWVCIVNMEVLKVSTTTFWQLRSLLLIIACKKLHLVVVLFSLCTV